MYFFPPPAPFKPQGGPKVQGSFTGHPAGTDCFYTGQSPAVLLVGKAQVLTFPLPGWEATGRHSPAGVGEAVAEEVGLKFYLKNPGPIFHSVGKRGR